MPVWICGGLLVYGKCVGRIAVRSVRLPCVMMIARPRIFQRVKEGGGNRGGGGKVGRQRLWKGANGAD